MMTITQFFSVLLARSRLLLLVALTVLALVLAMTLLLPKRYMSEAVIAVDGGSAWIHDLNDLIGAQLHTPQARLDYLRLFASHVHGGEGRFVPLESLERVADRATDAAALQARLAPHVRDILPDGFDDEGYRRFRATICYGDALFDAVFALTPDGLLEMVDDEPVAEGLPLRNERLEGLFLVLDEE